MANKTKPTGLAGRWVLIPDGDDGLAEGFSLAGRDYAIDRRPPSRPFERTNVRF